MTEPATQAEWAWDTTPMPAPRHTRAVARAVLVAVAVAVLIAVSLASAVTAHDGAPTATPAPTATAQGLPAGPGPQATYQAQRQPPAGTCRYRYEGKYPLPDAGCTPGATNPGVTQANIHSTICVRGWTATIRPPQSVTGQEKRANAASYGGGQNPRTTEYDHLLPLELGGDPNDPRNLWVELNDDPAATSFANAKDPVENAARAAVCAGKLPLPQVQVAMATDWPALGKKLGVLP